MQSAISAKKGKNKVVERKLVAVYTPGTITEVSLLPNSGAESYLIVIKEDEKKQQYGICIVDTTTSLVQIGLIQDDFQRSGLDTLFQQIGPKELIIEKGNTISKQTAHLIKNCCSKPLVTKLKKGTEFFDYERAVKEIGYEDFRDANGDISTVLKEFFEEPLVMCAFGAAIFYLKKAQASHILSLKNLKRYNPSQDSASMLLDGQTLLNLEIVSMNLQFIILI